MKSIVAIITILVAFTSFLILTSQPAVDPLISKIDFKDQEQTFITFDDVLLRSLQEDIVFSTMYFDLVNQTVSLNDNNSNAYLDFELKRLIHNLTGKTNYDALVLETKGFENFIDTQGISGTLQAKVVTLSNDLNTYVDSRFALLNPPFNISLDEKQYMSNLDASTEIITLIDVSAFVIDPIELFKSLTFNESNTSIHSLPFGHKLVITQSNVLFIGTQARIEVIIYNNFLIDMTIDLEGASVTIPQTLIDMLESDLEVSLRVTFHYQLSYETTSSIPYDEDDLEAFKLVDTFTLPDIQGFLDNFPFA